MGFDFTIVQIDTAANIIIDKYDNGYLSYNWSDLATETGWYLKDDLHGRIGKIVSERANNTITKMTSRGFTIGKPDMDNHNWGWGSKLTGESNSGWPETVQLPAEERMGVFLFHLNNIATLGDKYPDYYFISDGCDYGYYDENNEFHKISDHDMSDTDDYSEDPMSKKYITAFRHPTKGNMSIKTFKDAMEVFGILKSQGHDERADEWFKFAFWLEDAPSPPEDLDVSKVTGICMFLDEK